MKLTYRRITRYIVRLILDEPATIVVGGGRVTDTRYRCQEWNMSAVIACRATIHHNGKQATIEWSSDGPVQTGGDLAIEISKAESEPLAG